MSYYMGSVGGREFYVYESDMGSEFRCVCLFPEEQTFAQVEVIDGSMNKELAEEDVGLVSGQGTDDLGTVDADDRRLECFNCGSESRVGQEFVPDFWMSVRADTIDDDKDTSEWDPEDFRIWMDDNMIGGLRALFHGSAKFCDQCMYELERNVDRLKDEDFWAWVATQRL